jgi:serine protease AprX
MRIASRGFTTSFIGLAFLVGVTPAAAQLRPRLDRVLSDVVERQAPEQTHRVILRTKEGYGAWLRQELASQGVAINAEHPSIEGLTLTLSAAAIAGMCESTAVAGCAVDADVTATAAARGVAQSTSPARVASSLLGNLGLTNLSGGGSGVTVALDSGLYPSKAFQGRIKAFYDFTGGEFRRVRPFDDYGHGTHVAGLIGGAQAAGDQEYQGVAPAVNFVVLKVLDANGAGKASDVIRAIEFAAANASDDRLGIDIINLSLGHPIYQPAAEDPLVQAVERAVAEGVIGVAPRRSRNTLQLARTFVVRRVCQA